MRTRSPKKHNAANAAGLFLNWVGSNIVIGIKNAGIIAKHAAKCTANSAHELTLGMKGVDTTRNHRRLT